MPLFAGNNAYLKDFAVSNDKQAPITIGLFRLEAGDPITYTYEELVMSLDGTLTNQLSTLRLIFHYAHLESTRACMDNPTKLRQHFFPVKIIEEIQVLLVTLGLVIAPWFHRS